MLGLLKVIKIGWNISTLLNIINKFQSNTRKMKFNPAFDVKRELPVRPFIFLFLYVRLRIIGAVNTERECVLGILRFESELYIYN